MKCLNITDEKVAKLIERYGYSPVFFVFNKTGSVPTDASMAKELPNNIWVR